MSVHHKRLKEDPVPLSIVNPVYDDDIATEAENKNTGANNNANGSKTDQTVTSADVKVVIPEVSGDSPQVGCATNSTNANITANETKWPNGKEPTPNKLIEPEMTFSERCARKKCLIIATAVIVIAILVFVTLLAYFLNPRARSTDPTPTGQSLAEEQLGKDAGFELGLNGSSGSEGIVVAHFNGQLLNLCVHNWSINSAHVLCRQLGHQEAIRKRLMKDGDSNRKSVSIPKAPSCIGNEKNLGECPQKMSVQDVGRCVESILFVECETDSDPDSSKSTPSAISRSISHRSNTSPSTSLSTPITPSTALHTPTTTSLYTPTTLSFTPLTIKLNGSSLGLLHVGRLLVQHNNMWGTVCRHGWSEEEAMVVCRQLGFSNHSEAYILHTSTVVDPAPTQQVIWINRVNCVGNETNLGQCDFQAWNNSQDDGCSHVFDVVLSCLPDAMSTEPSQESTSVVSTSAGYHVTDVTTTQVTTSTTTSSQLSTTTTQPPTTTTALSVSSDATVSILFGKMSNEGLVVVTMNGTNYTLCDDFWRQEEAAVVCRMNGFSQVLEFHDLFLLDAKDDYSEAMFEIFSSKVVCEGNETDLSQCSFETHRSTCFHTDDVKVVCGPRPTTSTATTTTSTTATAITTTSSTITTDAAEVTTSSTTTTSVLFPSTASLPENRAIKERADIRLVSNLGNGSSGRLEVFYDNTWGTVCGFSWKPENEQVVCRQLHYPGVEGRIYTERESEGITHGEDDQRIWLTSVKCQGIEEYLTACEHELADERTCIHSQDIMLSCRENGTEPTTATPEAHNDGDIRLNPGEHRGRLEYYWDGKWGAVCNEGWDSTDALVACRQLGYSNVTGHSLTEFTVEGSEPEYVVSQMSCNGSEQRLADCSHLDDEQDDCYDAYAFWSDAGSRIFIECDPLSKVNSSDVDDVIRLVHGLNDSNVGMLQYKKDGQWGSLCNEGWTLRSAVVACTQLGFPGVQIYNLSVSEILGLQNSDYTSTFHGKTYQCNSIDEEIADCSHFGFATDCQHKQDEVALVCEPMTTETSTETSVNVTKDDTVRLVGGTSSRDGRVEMSVNGTWGRVCNNDGDWTHTDMAFVCYGLFGTTNFTAQFSDSLQSLSGNGSFVGGDFSCNATAAYLPKLNECQYNSSSTYLSECSDDALVKCL